MLYVAVVAACYLIMQVIPKLMLEFEEARVTITICSLDNVLYKATLHGYPSDTYYILGII